MAVVIACNFLVTGCSQFTTVIPKHVNGFATWSDTLPPHRIAAGDEIELRFLLNPELNDTRLVIGPDGRVTVPLLGPVLAAGLTVDQFRTQLETGYASKLRVADLDVVIRNYGSCCHCRARPT
jgi:protein involved in polysaccharide export with SLBB domain